MLESFTKAKEMGNRGSRGEKLGIAELIILKGGFMVEMLKELSAV